MKKIFFLLFLFSVLILQANQIEVCKSCNISTIKKAIEIAEDGDEIFIRKGVYQENDIEVNKSLIIFGSGNSAYELGNLLNPYCSKIIIIGKQKFRLLDVNESEFDDMKDLDLQTAEELN